MKKNIFLIVIICSFITGCFNIDNTNMDKKYKKYWKYALGEYKSSYKWVTSDSSAGLVTNVYRSYKFEYKNYKNENKSFYIYNDKIFKDDRRFGEVCSRLLDDEFENIIVNKFNKNLEYELDTKYPVYVNIKKIDKTIKYYDQKKGVKIKELNSNNFSSNNLTISIQIRLNLLKKYDNIENIEQQILSDFSYLLEYYDYNNIVILFELTDKNDSYRTTYLMMEYDGHNFNWEFDDLLSESNMWNRWLQR